MKQHFRELVGFLTILISIFSFVAAFAAESAVSPGQKLFEGKCAQCHGKDAKGVAKMAKVLKIDPIKVNLTRAEAVSLTSADIVTTVTNGKNKMPKYKGKLTDTQIEDVAAYLKTVQKDSTEK